MDKTELRHDPLTGSWTLFSSARSGAPDFPSVLTEPATESPFAAGRENLAPHTLYRTPAGSDPWQVRVVPNRTPILRVEGDPTLHSDGFYDHCDGVGAHEVIIEDPGAALFHELPLPDVLKILHAWKSRMLDLLRDTRMRSFTIVKNVGRPAGALTGHSISQLVAMALVPPTLRRKLGVARHFYSEKKRSIFEDILAEEIRAGSRLVYENNGFTVFCPYASRVPFEIVVYPKRQSPDFHAATDEELAQLADALRQALRRLNRALDHPPYNLILTTAPTRTARHDQWTTINVDFRWHIEILPRLHYPGGIELATGCSVNGVWPEVAAGYLRDLPSDEMVGG